MFNFYYFNGLLFMTTMIVMIKCQELQSTLKAKGVFSYK